ncbi:hypothetical protein LCGC14_0636110 [marine sediment metagenome]|uniref:Uncharacterized protein n=1 Tax=marine sediment metagenome TaxID=412755 RepID=A0A0F9U8X5_9ZZZZ
MILDPIIKLFDPVINYTYQNYENNYLYYALLGGFLLLLVLVGYLMYKAITS